MGLLKPWDSFEVGDSISVLCELVYIDDDLGPHHFVAMGYGKMFQLVGVKIEDGHFFTIADARICETGERIVLGVESDTLIWPHVVGGFQQICSCIELCAGAGFSMEGICAAGFRPVVSIESNEKFRNLHSAMHSCPFVCCDIGSTDALRAVCDLKAEGCSVMAGINCQPYSIAGDKKRESDQRASSLPKALMFSLLIRAQIVVLECTPLARNDEFVQRLIHEFAHYADMTVVQQVLTLGSCWASRRDRWWCVMARRHFGVEAIPALPVMKQFQKVSAIMPYIKHWPDAEVSQLVLSLYEHGKFIDYGGGLSPHYLDMDSQMATALHAWGNQVYPCKCGCRVGFSEERMQQKGLHGQIIPSRDMIERMGESFPCCRHMHPCEVILLCGAFPGRVITGDMRLALAAVGQMASPMHSVWVFGHIRCNLQIFFAHAPVVDAVDLLGEWQQEVLSARDQLWPQVSSANLLPTRALSMPVPPRISFPVRVPNVPGFIDVFAVPGTTVGELVAAEAALVGDSSSTLFVTSLQLTGRMQLVDSSHVLQAGDVVCVSTSLPEEVESEHAARSFPSLSQEDAPMLEHQFPVSEALELPVDFGRAKDETSPVTPIVVEPIVVEKAEFDFTMWQDPLSKLTRQGLLQVMCPQALTVGAFQGLRKQTISGVLRKLVLKNQEGAIGDDEILFHLTEIAQHVSSDQHVVVWDPLVMTALAKLRQGHVVFQWASDLPPKASIVTAIVVGSHWVPIVWRKVDDQLLGFTSFVPVDFQEVVQELHAYVCRICECCVSNVNFAHHSPTARFCGTAAIRFVIHLLTGESLICTDSDLAIQHAKDVERFRQECVHRVSRPWIWGLGFQDGQAQLNALLRQHGVEVSDAGARCEKIFAVLGRDEVSKALKSLNPWKNLKWLANQQVPPYQLIQPQELQQAIVARSKSGVPVGNRAQKAKGKGKGKGDFVSEVNPDSLRLEAGVFVGNDSPLSQLKISQLGPVASGVVLATLDQAMPYLQSGKQVSMGSLGIVVLNPPSVAPTVALIGARVKFPVFCVANAEPLIVEGDLYQLGATPVIKHAVADTVHLQTIETSVVKIVVYKDGVDQWSQVVSKPIHYILSQVQCLNRCAEEVTCECPKWHVTEGGVTDPVMELWNRQWLSFTFTSVKPSEADMFSVTARVPKILELKLLALSGSAAICFEPRSLDGRKPSDDFSVVWMPKVTAAQALLLKQTNVHVVGLARLGSKWGLRSKAANASQLHEAVKPESEFLPAGQRHLYLIGPLPFGIVRQSLVDALKELGWAARPLHAVPAARDVSGVMWKVQSTSAPPKAVLSLKDGEAVITRFDQTPVAAKTSRPVIGSSVTVSMCKQFASTERPLVDPFQICDPWAKSGAVSSDNTKEAKSASEVMATMEQRVIDAVISQMPSKVSQEGNVGARVEALENQVSLITAQQQGLHQTFQEQSVAHQAQLTDLQFQFQAQHGQLEAAVAEQGQHLAGLTHNFQAQMEKQQSQLDRMFSQQMTRIEDILGANKKPRVD